MSVNQASFATFDIGRVISRTFSVIGRNFVTFTVLALLLKAIPALLIGAWTLKQQMAAFGSVSTAPNPFAMFTGQNALITLVSTLVSIVSVYVLQAALLRGTIADLSGKRASLGDMLTTGLRFFFPLLGLAILMFLAVAAASILLIVPGIMLAVAWCAAAPALVAEKKGVFEAFSRSADLTRGSRWSIFGLFVIYAVVSRIIGATMSALMLVNRNDFTMMMSISLVIQVVVGALTALIGSAGAASIYYELRSNKEGFGVDQLASVFD